MGDIAASVLARLKDKAKKSGENYRLCLQFFCQEEFLRRLEKSKYAENFILKGRLLTCFYDDFTVDVNFLLCQIANNLEKLKAILEEIVATPTENDFINFEIKDFFNIDVDEKNAGIGTAMVVCIENTKIPLGICFGFCDTIASRQEKQKVQTQLDDFAAPTVNSYSAKTSAPEEHDDTLSLIKFSGRMKEYYKMYYLANEFELNE